MHCRVYLKQNLYNLNCILNRPKNGLMGHESKGQLGQIYWMGHGLKPMTH